jgi:hypothetical protein
VTYDLSLEPDRDRGGHVYRASLSGDLEPDAVRELSDWLGHAKQNPDASFVLDVSAATPSAGARIELRALLRRHADLTPARRLSILTGARRSAAAAA